MTKRDLDQQFKDALTGIFMILCGYVSMGLGFYSLSVGSPYFAIVEFVVAGGLMIAGRHVVRKAVK
jgi:hypothetical protein